MHYQTKIKTIKTKTKNMKSKIHNLATIQEFKTEKTGYGHWLTTITLENPNLLLDDSDYYWTMVDREDEDEYVTFRKTTTDSRAIDGHDGYEVSLAQECLNANEVNCYLVDFSTLKGEKDA